MISCCWLQDHYLEQIFHLKNIMMRSWKFTERLAENMMLQMKWKMIWQNKNKLHDDCNILILFCSLYFLKTWLRMLVIKRKAIQWTIHQQTGKLRPYQHAQEWKTKNLAAEARQRVKLRMHAMSFLYYYFLFKNFTQASFCLIFLHLKILVIQATIRLQLKSKGRQKRYGRMKWWIRPQKSPNMAIKK